MENLTPPVFLFVPIVYSRPVDINVTTPSYLVTRTIIIVYEAEVNGVVLTENTSTMNLSRNTLCTKHTSPMLDSFGEACLLQ